MTMTENGRTEHLVPDADTENPPMNMLEPFVVPGRKQGHVVCGCCCDVRRATIIVNILLLFQTIGEEPFSYFLTMTGQLDDFELFSHTPAVIAWKVLQCLFYAAAILGALQFNAWLVMANIIFFVVSTVLTLVTNYQNSDNYFAVRDMIYALFIMSWFIYPSVMLVYELKVSKTMSKQTYPREKHSCCCVPYSYRRDVYDNA